MSISRLKKYELLRVELENERASFISHWRDLGDYILPRKTRLTVTDTNRGERKNQKIIDSTATLAVRTLRSGMMSGVTSPARPWFKLDVVRPGMSEVSGVKEWLDNVTKDMINIFLKSNLYNVLPTLYGSLGTFATGAMAVEEDFDDVVRFTEFPIGSYSVSNDHKGRVIVFFRELRYTVRQLVEKFGKMDSNEKIMNWENFSPRVKSAYESGKLEVWIDVYQCVKKNEDYNTNKLEAKYKRYTSVYYEKGVTGIGKESFLKESGFDSFRVLCPRWERSAEDVYGTECPGMICLGDVKALQVMHKRKAQAVEKMVNPPMVAPTSMRTVTTSILPGDITYADETENQKGFRPAQEVNIQLQPLLLDIEQHQERINKSFYVDLFLMLSSSDRRQITATEVNERHEEKLLALGPVLEQINQDLLDPLIDITFEIMLKQGRVPEPPPEIQGEDLKVEYTSIMAQAQKLVSLGGIERFSGFASQVISVNPEALDKINIDELLNIYGDLTSIPPGIVRSDEDVASMRNARAEQQRMAQMAELARQGAQTAKDLSGTDLEGDNALSRMIEKAKAGQLVQQ